MLKFRDLMAEEVDARIGQIGNGYITLLLYKDARCDMNILDETVGAENWQRRHYEVKGNMYCSVGIYIDGRWVYKDDCGTESNTEAKKGESSDSFKRACVNWGIGRSELYTCPKIFIKCDTKKNDKGKYETDFIDFTVDKMTVKNKKITELSISAYDKASKQRITVYVYPTATKTAKTVDSNQEPKKSIELQKAFDTEVKIDGEVKKLGDLSTEYLDFIIKSWSDNEKMQDVVRSAKIVITYKMRKEE